MVAMITALLLAAAPPVCIDVVVPLCDSALINCGAKAAGDPESLAGNLYWGAAYGAERYLSKLDGYKVERRVDAPSPDRPHVLREVQLTRKASRGEREVRLRLIAYSGKAIDQALADFLSMAAGASTADLVVWAGHDRLMDVPAPSVARSARAKPAVVLACSSQQFFGPVLDAIGSSPLALTRTFMAPEAYLLEALASAVAKGGLDSPPSVRKALIEAYAKFQRIAPKSAASVFAVIPAPAPGASSARP